MITTVKDEKSLVGRKFGDLTVVSDCGRDSNPYRVYLCKCECGKDRKVFTSCLIRKAAPIRSCGLGSCKYSHSKPKRSNIEATLNGETHTLRKWCEIKKMSYHTVYNRVIVLKWPIERALFNGIEKDAFGRPINRVK